MSFLAPQALHAKGRTILIFAPHPDDEALCCSGLINAAKLRGDTVKVVLITNGDSYLDPASPELGYEREPESIAAMTLLGLNESDLIFLGYGDQDLKPLFQSTSPSKVIPSLAGQTQTYANRGLGHKDYHTFLYGVPGLYNRETILGDMEAVIQNIQPDEIYTTGLLDAHPDHSGTYQFTIEAVNALHRKGFAKTPRIHVFIIHAPCEFCSPTGFRWPMPAFTPSQPFAVPPSPDFTRYQADQIERIPVPASMQDPSPTTNLKNRAISQYVSQMREDPIQWLFSFVKNDEIFWIRKFPPNLAPLATVSVSSENVESGALGIKAVDQRIPGITSYTDAEWATKGETAGAWIRLTWPGPVKVSQVVLYDRPSMADNIRSGTLSFSDGSTVSVGALPENGIGAPISFASKTVTFVQFTVNSASGRNVGLSEMEVFESPAGLATNNSSRKVKLTWVPTSLFFLLLGIWVSIGVYFASIEPKQFELLKRE